MVWFWVGAGFLTLTALAVLLRPLIYRPRPGSGEEEAVAALFRRQLAEAEAELAQGRITPDQAAVARTEITRRMLAAAGRGDAGAGAALDGGSETFWRIGAAIGIAGVLPAAAVAVYFAVGSPSAIDRSATTEAAVKKPAAPEAQAR